MIRIYFAGPLFSLAERNFNLTLTQNLKDLGYIPKHGYEIILPQEEADKIIHQENFFKRMYDYCIDEVDKCDCIIAILDGADADSGTCIEIGRGKKLGKPIIGIRTDPRGLEDRGVNLMISNSCTKLIGSAVMDMSELTEELVKVLQECLK